jgi:hypothetical protein
MVRPPGPYRNVFVRGYAPCTPFVASGPVSVLVRKAIERVGVKSARTGAHIFRHSLATEMLRRGASLAEIVRVLRHRDPDSTAIYARVHRKLTTVPPLFGNHSDRRRYTTPNPPSDFKIVGLSDFYAAAHKKAGSRRSAAAGQLQREAVRARACMHR